MAKLVRYYNSIFTVFVMDKKKFDSPFFTAFTSPEILFLYLFCHDSTIYVKGEPLLTQKVNHKLIINTFIQK